jgi:hypothetical protein
MSVKYSLKNANGPGSPRPFVRTDDLVPRQGQIQLSRRSPRKSSYFRRAAPRPATSPHVPERQFFPERKVDLKGFEPSPLTLTGSCATSYTTSPRQKLKAARRVSTAVWEKISRAFVSFRERRSHKNAKVPESKLVAAAAKAGSSPSLRLGSE